MINTPKANELNRSYVGNSIEDLENDAIYLVHDSSVDHSIYSLKYCFAFLEDGIFAVDGDSDNVQLRYINEDSTKYAYFLLVKDMLENNDSEFILNKGDVNEYWVANYQICESVIYKVTWNEEDCEHEWNEATIKECKWVLKQAEKSIEMVKKWNESRK